MVTFVLKVMMLLGYVAYTGGPTDAVLVWSGASAAPVSPCITEPARCAMAKAEVLPLDGHVPAPPGADLAFLEEGNALRPALADEFAAQDQAQDRDLAQGGPLFENGMEEDEAKP